MKQISVEYAHIYTNAQIGEEHELSLKSLDQFDPVENSFVVMVDDYSFPDPTFDYSAFTKWLANHGHAPDVVLRESQLIPQCDQVLEMLPDVKQKSDIVEYIKKSKKHPCSLFISSWYLLRLGKLTHPEFLEVYYADKLINILPSSFKPFEDKAFDILRSTPFAELVGKIENRYFEGRSVASTEG